jgi:hypothetical protein
MSCSRLTVPRGDHVRLWRNVARLQETAGKTEEAQHSRDNAARIQRTNAWLRDHGMYR